MTDIESEYGFRCDPMEWAKTADTLDGAWVRTMVLEEPKEGDEVIIQKECDRLLAQQAVDSQNGKETHNSLMRLLDLGYPPGKPESQEALKAMHDKAIEEGGLLAGYELHIACRAGWPERDELRRATEKANEELASVDFWGACPWSGEVHLQALWAAREYADVMPAIERGLTIMRDHLKDGRHWPIYLDPFGWLECMGHLDHPLAKEIVVKMLPMVLRAQHPDGSWGGEDHLGYGPGNHTFIVFRALHKWGLLEPLRQKPPLPPEWKVAKTIPAPDGDLKTMTWDGTRFWVYDKTTSRAVAVSTEDGQTQAEVKLPEPVGGIAWSNDDLLATRVVPEAVLVVDPNTGEVKQEISAQTWGEFSAIAELDERICIGNVYCGGVHILQDGQVGPHPSPLAGGFTVDMACAEGSIWHIDTFNKLLIRTDPSEGRPLLDWASAPFGEDTTGLAHDGEHLWALDNKEKRICMIERAE